MRSHSATVCLVAAMLAASLPVGAAASDTVRPRILEARMRDADADGRADRVTLRYSETIRHRRDADGSYPFSVDGYDISFIRGARGTSHLVIVVDENLDPDPSSRPSIHYQHTRQQPVRDIAGMQAVEQSFSATLPLSFQLTVTPSGTGTGTVMSASAGINCGVDCDERFRPGTSVTLTATPAPGSTFQGWSGACSGAVPDCDLTMNSDVHVTATFTAPDAPGGDGNGAGGGATGGGGGTGGSTGGGSTGGGVSNSPTFALTVTKAGAGSGSVTSVPAGIDCGADCTESYASGTSVTLTATASSGSVFAGWSGACSGSGTCVVTMDAARAVTATFDIQTFALTVAKAGAGSGSVSSVPAGIDCGADCSESYASGTSVTLTATASSGSVFAGWSGACSGSASTCTVTMDAARDVTATFDIQTVALTVSRAGTGSGTVTSIPAGIDCGADCSESYASGTTVTLTAVAALGSVFGGWSGDCSGVLTTCVVTMDQVRNVTATFNSL